MKSSMTSSTHRSTYSSAEEKSVNMLPFDNPKFDPHKHMPSHDVVAVLCSGPNLDVYDPSEPYGLVIGVNRATTFHECDWLVAEDICNKARQSAFTKEWCDINGYPKGNPKVFSGGMAGMRRLDKEIGEPPVGFELVKCFPGELNWPWQSFSVFAAIMLAYRLGAKYINCYGVYWDGNLDSDGKAFKSRNVARWTTERFMFRQCTDWLETKGVRLARILHKTGEEPDVEIVQPICETPTHIEAGMTMGVAGGEFCVEVQEDEDYEVSGGAVESVVESDSVEVVSEEVKDKETCNGLSDAMPSDNNGDPEPQGECGV